jgi:hypothetical protein
MDYFKFHKNYKVSKQSCGAGKIRIIFHLGREPEQCCVQVTMNEKLYVNLKLD